MHYLLFYDVAADYPERRSQYRNRHRELAWQAHDRGEHLLGGALADPYVTEGLVTRWRVNPWSTVVGVVAATPLRSDAPRAWA